MTLLIQFIQNFFVDVNSAELIDFFLRLAINYFSVFILIRYIYYPRNGQQEYFFTFYLMALVVFLIASSLENLKIELGFALGLFAIFSIIRFRTPPFELKEMTYLFTAIGLSVLNALVDFKMPNWLGMIISNVIVLITALSIENYKPRKLVMKKMLTFTPTDLDIVNSRKRLLEEVKQNTNIQVFKVELIKINSIKREICVWIYFQAEE
jgi:hypothetical protein